MNNSVKIEKRTLITLADVFALLNKYPKSEEEWDCYHQLINSSCLYFSLSAKPFVSDTLCCFDDSIQDSRDMSVRFDENDEFIPPEPDEYIYPEFATANDFQGYYSGGLLATIFGVLRAHVENPSIQQFIDSLNYYQCDDEKQAFLAIDRPFPAFISVEEYGNYPIDLAAPNSHLFKKRKGYPLTIAPKSLDEKADFIVEPEECINWHALTVPFVSRAGGLITACLSYTGNDSGFFAWSHTCPINEITWMPLLAEDCAVDAGNAKIHRLTLLMKYQGAHLHLKLSALSFKDSRHGLSELILKGDLSRLSFSGNLPTNLRLRLCPSTGRRQDSAPYQLPDLGLLHNVAQLDLHNEPLAQPISLACLARFSSLEYLDIYGNFCDFEYLLSLKHLKYLGFRYAPNLKGFPDLADFEQLESLIIWNAEEATGKRLRKQFKARAAVRPWQEYSGVSKLRKPEWWEKEYGNPFREWRGKLKKIADSAYQTAQTTLQQAVTQEQAQAAFSAFAERFNHRNDIETIEREDIGEAVFKLAQLPHLAELGVSEEMAQQWFDEVRDY